MNLYNWLCLIGVPALLGSAWAYIFNLAKQTKAIKSGLQALLRAQMIEYWNKWSERGYAPIYARESFENLWLQYHSLGANGVMNDIHDRFIELPTKKEGTV